MVDLNLLEHDSVYSLTEINKTYNILKPTELLLQSYKLNTFSHVPNKLPMVVKPKTIRYWKNENGESQEILGGYLYNNVSFVEKTYN